MHTLRSSSGPCILRATPALLLVVDRRNVLRAAHPAPPPGHRRALGAVPVRAAAADAPPPPRRAGAELRRSLTSAPGKLKAFVAELDGLWGRFLPMCLLFFAMAFNNTILDSVKDSLVITAKGGGTQVIPFLTVYAVLPSSLLFLLAYSYATQRFDRGTLFNAVVSVFLAFFAMFALAYPSHEALHAHALGTTMAQALPPGLSGLVGMVRNWTFTAFYCFSELWGDVVLSLLFWGLANETTPMRQAPLLYPLFGVGANIAQVAGGRVLSLLARSAGDAAEYAANLRVLLGLVVGMGVVVMALHTHIFRTFPRTREGLPRKLQEKERRILEASNSNGNGARTTQRSKSQQEGPACVLPPEEPAKLSLREAFAFLIQSPQIRALALMAIAQGVCTNVLDLAWKSHLRLLHPTPAAYSAFMGEVAMATGVVTGALMLATPLMFRLMQWRGVAAATPMFMMAMGVPFFMGCIAYNVVAAGAARPRMLLQALVIAGAVLQVFGKAAKFSCFKPCEEMVYIGLDEESRTKGKAAIDVVGAQTGKSAGSVLQQGLLLASGGHVAGMLPFLLVIYAGMLQGWLGSVRTLAEHYDPASHHAEDNDSIPPVLLATVDVDEEDQGSDEAAVVVPAAAAMP